MSRLIPQSISDTIWIVPYEAGEKAFISDSVVTLLGYTPDDFDSLPPDKIMEPGSYERFLQVLEYYKEIRFVIGRKSQPVRYDRIFEFMFIHSSGRELWIEAASNPFINEEGEPVGVIFSLRDISGRKKQEEDYNKKLSEQLELNKFKSQVISTISHEFRTPISVIYSNLQLLKKFSYSLEEGIQKDAFELTTMAIHSLSKTLDNLTLLNRSNKGILGYELQDIDLELECKKIATEINSIEQYNGRITTKFDIFEKNIKMDKTLMHHILSNLIVNALKFSPAGKKIDFFVKSRNGKLEFNIRDEGIGIPEEELAQIFESFYRGSNTKDIKGTGLGLSIVKRCVDVLNGKINIVSHLDKGTLVKVTIPYERSES